MQVAVFSARPYDVGLFGAANAAGHTLLFHEARLSADSLALAAGADAVCPFVNDDLSAPVVARLADLVVRRLALRSAGFNHVDLAAAAAAGVAVARVPAYSPHAVAEHAVALILTLDRKSHRAFARVREGNFELHGLLGFDLHGKTVGIVGTGPIGRVLARVLAGFGCRLLAHDPFPHAEMTALGVAYVPVETLVTFQCPLTPETQHLIDDDAIARMKPGVMLINRGAVVDTRAVIRGLKSGRIGSLGLDVYEEEGDLFFQDFSDRFIDDDVFARLLTFPNVLVTGHQAFFTTKALAGIAETTIANVTAFAKDGRPLHPVGESP